MFFKIKKSPLDHRYQKIELVAVDKSLLMGGRGWGSFPFWLCACASGYLYLFQTPGVTPPFPCMCHVVRTEGSTE